MNIMNRNTLSISAICLILVTGCGGGSSSNDDTAGSETITESGEDSNSDNADLLTGIFVDSAVEGASYTTETQSGVTNAAGEFLYRQGENVTFSIGTLMLPTIPAAAQVSPVDMASSSVDPTATTTNIARLLQSLDQDGNPDNGILISAEATSNASAVSFDVSTEVFANDPAVINLVANAGSVNSSLISADAANQHLNATLGVGDMMINAPDYRMQFREGEGQAFIANNVITIITPATEGSRSTNRLVVDTQSRLIADLAVTEAIAGQNGTVAVRVLVKLYNDTVNVNETTPENSAGDVTIDVKLESASTENGFDFSACTVRDVNEEEQEEIFILGGESCIFDTTPIQIGERLQMGVEIDRDTGALAIIRGDTRFEYQVPGPRFPAVDPFNRVETVAVEGQSQITTEVYGIGSDNIDDDFSGGVTVEGVE